MKTFWLMIGGSAVLTVAMAFVGMYRISKLDSTTQPQNTLQVQKQHISESVPAKKTSEKAASESPAKSAPATMPSVAGVKPGDVMNGSVRERIDKAQHRQGLPAVRPQGYLNNNGVMRPALPGWAMNWQDGRRMAWNGRTPRRSAGDTVSTSRLRVNKSGMSQFDAFAPAADMGIAGEGEVEGSGSLSSIVLPHIPQMTPESSGTASTDEAQTSSDSPVVDSRLSPELLQQPPFQRATNQLSNPLMVPKSQQATEMRGILQQMPVRYQGLLDVVDGKADPAVVISAIHEEQVKSSQAGKMQKVSNSVQSAAVGHEEAPPSQVVTRH